jgi:hypothetical protein
MSKAPAAIITSQGAGFAGGRGRRWFPRDVEHTESGDPVKLEGRTGTNTFSRAFAWPGIRAASSSVWGYSANAGVIVVEAKLVDGLACPFFIRNPDEISRPGECSSDVKAEVSDRPQDSVRCHEFGSIILMLVAQPGRRKMVYSL